ncbi:SDR family oxidoreductase [Saccharomonospora sp. NPDC046836]|uniref:SDR family oxidoreductase n=1 Tax=Saccharomonospora sp. NPDC046836 TaxID=3156921 RepID=UPI0033E33A0B
MSRVPARSSRCRPCTPAPDSTGSRRTRPARAEWRRSAACWRSNGRARGVRVNVLAPGYFHTGLSDGLVTSKWRERIHANIPQDRVASPPELGGAAVYLASDAASYTTGSTLTVDGGWTA